MAVDDPMTENSKDAFMEAMTIVLNTAERFKKVMVAKKLKNAVTKCPKCKEEKLHGVLITGKAAGRHAKSGGAFRMWCDNCETVRMME